MSNLQELKNTAENPLLNKIKEIKNTGVEFRKLGEICKRQKGINITALQMKELNKDNGKIRIFAGGNTIANVNYEDIPNASIIDIPSIIVKSRGKVDFEYYDKPFTHKNELWSYSQNSDKIYLKFIYYYLCNNLDYFIKKSVRGAMPQIATPDTDDFEIPIPPLEVQAEIVRILDTFTELIKELIKEHELRKKQYSYYRDKLLTFGEDSLKKRFRDTCIIKSGEFASPKELSKIQDDLHIYPCYGSNGLRGYINKFNYDGEYPIVGRVGALCGSVNYVSGKFFVTDNALIVQSKGEYIPRFLYYLLISLNLNKYKAGGAQPAIAGKTIYDLSAPLPPLDTQKRIVDILDNFDKYTNDLQEGLPAEIEKRQKQYAYYRDELLRFERK